jgi:pyruvate formate lyase activating enzyme
MSACHREMVQPGVVFGQWWHRLDDGRIQCDLCPRECKLHEGQRGFCFVRRAQNGGVVLTTYGRASGFCIDPIEKKPLNHFYPGTSVLSFGTTGCNLGCRFCQNWDISKARAMDQVSDWASPEQVVEAAAHIGSRSIAFTYNDPVIFAEYAIDCAQAAHERGIKTVAVTAGYINPEPRRDFYAHMDAANVDLKAFTGEFYHKLCFGELQPVLDTLRWLKSETSVWFEVTTLLLPGHNDSEEEIARLSDWFLKNLGPDVPLHFTAFHPDFKMLDVPATPPETSFAPASRRSAPGCDTFTSATFTTRKATRPIARRVVRCSSSAIGMSLDATTLMSVAAVPSAMRDCQVASTQCPGSGDGDGYRFSSSVEEGSLRVLRSREP